MKRHRIRSALESSATTLGVAAGILLLFVGGLTVADVVSRNFLGHSILGVVEISTLLLVAIAFLGMASAEVNSKHVSVSLVEERVSIRGRQVLSMVRVLLLVLLACALLFGMSTILEDAVSRGETTNDILRLPTWPAKLVLLISFALFFIAAGWKELRNLHAFKSGQDPFAMQQQAELDLITKQMEPRDEP